jgi:POT family proton-dependent oligopeptide transporter
MQHEGNRMTATTGTADMKQPRGLYTLFSTEAFERFSYYGMRALLVLYLVNHLKFERADALSVYAIYTGLVYFTPLIGGYLADKFLGARKAILIGGVVMGLGQFSLAFSAILPPGTLGEQILNVGLGLLICGNGFFKPNISTIVGGLYHDNDPRRDGGFTIFYMGINLGAFFSPLVCGTLGELVGWGWGFFMAGLGMALGIAIFIHGQHKIGLAGFPPGREVTAETELTRKDYQDVFLYILACIALTLVIVLGWAGMGALGLNGILKSGVMAIGIIGMAAMGQKMLQSSSEETVEARSHKEPLTTEEKHRLVVICILTFFNIFFWMGFEQAGGTMNLFADQNTNRHLFGFEIPASYFQSINPLIIVTGAPLFSIMWKYWDRSKFALATSQKMATGMLLLGLGFVVMFFAQKLAFGGVLVSPLWLVAVYFIHTMGELFLSPIGLSMITKLSPVRMVSLMMGVWFTSSAIANFFAGKLEALLHSWQEGAEDPTGLLWTFLIISSMSAGILLWILSPLLNKWTHGRG